MNEIENNDTIERCNEAQSLFLVKVNKIENNIARLIKKKER